MLELTDFLGVITRGSSESASEVERAKATMMKSTFRRLNWIEPSALRSSIARASAMPGCQAYASARDTAEALRALATGRVISQRALADCLRSRRTAPAAGTGRQTKMHRLFDDAEFGLGVQLGIAERAGVALAAADGAEQSWGHLAANGSFAIVVPGCAATGARPLVAVLLVNLDQQGPSGEPAATEAYASDNAHVFRAVLRQLVAANVAQH